MGFLGDCYGFGFQSLITLKITGSKNIQDIYSPSHQLGNGVHHPPVWSSDVIRKKRGDAIHVPGHVWEYRIDSAEMEMETRGVETHKLEAKRQLHTGDRTLLFPQLTSTGACLSPSPVEGFLVWTWVHLPSYVQR